MTPEQITIVKSTWKMFRGIDPVIIGDTFYSKLFNDHPQLRRMFPDNMDDQYKKLMAMLNAIIGRLDNLSDLSGEIAAMAERHTHYGVRPAHYKMVGSALLWTLKQGLGRDWTPETEAAWLKCYSTLSSTMLQHADKV